MISGKMYAVSGKTGTIQKCLNKNRKMLGFGKNSEKVKQQQRILA